jgi:hypothetical protein
MARARTQGFVDLTGEEREINDEGNNEQQNDEEEREEEEVEVEEVEETQERAEKFRHGLKRY